MRVRKNFQEAVKRCTNTIKELSLTVDEVWGFKVIPSEPYERPGSKEFFQMVKAGNL